MTRIENPPRPELGKQRTVPNNAMKRSMRQDALQKLVSQGVITPATSNAIIETCDPFHDFEWDPIGLPDSIVEPSICRKVKKSLNIKSPFADLTQPFDCHIFTLPEGIAYTQYSDTPDAGCLTFTSKGTSQTAGSAGLFPVAPIVVVCVPQGTDTTPANGNIPIGTNITVQWLDFNSYFSGNTREISSAFEVHNVTNALNVAGTATVYRLPQSLDETSVRVLSADGTQAGDFHQSIVSRCPPATLAQAMLLPGTRQWEAKDGCYVVETYDQTQNRPRPTQLGQRFFLSGDFLVQTASPAYSGQSLSGFARFAGAPSASFSTPSPYQYVPKDTSGVIFTGLTGQTQLTLTVCKVIETFPTFTDPLVTLARKTPDHDPMFFELYKRISQTMPPGVMVGENDAGDFWDRILGVVKDVAPIIGSAFGPVGGMIGTAASAVAGIVKKNRGKDEPKKKRDDTNFRGKAK